MDYQRLFWRNIIYLILPSNIIYLKIWRENKNQPRKIWNRKYPDQGRLLSGRSNIRSLKQYLWGMDRMLIWASGKNHDMWDQRDSLGACYEKLSRFMKTIFLKSKEMYQIRAWTVALVHVSFQDGSSLQQNELLWALAESSQ